MNDLHFRRNTIPLVVIALFAALIARAAMQTWLLQRGFAQQVAADLAYLLVPAVLLLLTIPIWKDARSYVAGLYRRSDLTLKVVVSAIAIGILMRVAWWSITFARISFGWFTQSADEAVGPSFNWQCDPPLVLALGIVVMAILVPIVEEIIHRGYIYRAALRWGISIAILVSAIVFAIAHSAPTWPTAFVAGIIFAIQFQRCGSLWPSTITHLTFNLLVQLDWRCLRGQWVAQEGQLPIYETGLPALITFAISVMLIVVLLKSKLSGTTSRPGQ